jgi:hypothetical protein
MLTGTLFNSKAMGNDGVWRNTDFNGNFIANALGGCEKPLSKNTTLSVGGKVTWGGGKRYSVFDTAKSRLISSGMAIDSIRNQLQTKNYFRADLKLGLRINAKKITHEIAIDLVNILNTKNVLGLAYNAEAARVGENPTSVRYQLGFLPLFYYKIDF